MVVEAASTTSAEGMDVFLCVIMYQYLSFSVVVVFRAEMLLLPLWQKIWMFVCLFVIYIPVFFSTSIVMVVS